MYKGGGWSCGRKRARTWTAKSAMMTPLRASSHHASNRSRLSPVCSMLGVASTTAGTKLCYRRGNPACVLAQSRKSNGFRCLNAAADVFVHHLDVRLIDA